MKIYKVKVNGKAYVVEVEAVEENNNKINVEKPVQTAQGTTPVAPAGGEASIKAPMAGTILNVKVNVGDVVNAGDVVVVLEAMKLENDVVAQSSGTVKAINVSKGSSVKLGEVMVVLG